VDRAPAATRVAIALGEPHQAKRNAHHALTCAADLRAHLLIPDILEFTSPTSCWDPVILAALVGVLSDPRADSGLAALFAGGGCRSSRPGDLRSEYPFAGRLGGSSGVAAHALAQQDQRVLVAAGHGVGQPAQLDCEPVQVLA
jgi:hypothetical protein